MCRPLPCLLPAVISAVLCLSQESSGGKYFYPTDFSAYASIIIALICAYVLKYTRVGLHLRAVGENPGTADAAGIPVGKYKYAATCAGCMIAGLGGLYYVMDYACGVWSNDAFGDRGWLAIALVIFTIWRPVVSTSLHLFSLEACTSFTCTFPPMNHMDFNDA